MKKLYLFLFTLASFSGVFANFVNPHDEDKATKTSQLSFNVSEYNFGRINESGKKVTHDFIFTNTGESPLVITRIITSCKCVSTNYTKKPVPPGGQGMLSVSYDPKKQRGVFHKGIQVFSNTPEGMHIVIVKGEVAP